MLLIVCPLLCVAHSIGANLINIDFLITSLHGHCAFAVCRLLIHLLLIYVPFRIANFNLKNYL